MAVLFSSELETLYKKIDAFVPTGKEGTLPRIGISANRKENLACLSEPYYQSVLMAGGAPVIIPATDRIDVLTEIVKTLDGIIFSGGGDFDPSFFAEEPIPELEDVDRFRDMFDFTLLRIAFNHQLPVMGICRGHQLINIAFGGTLYQDIPSQFPASVASHSQSEPRDVATHQVAITDRPSRLKQLLAGRTTIAVNSLHHQAVKTLAPEFIETAVSPDGVNEAIEHAEYPIFAVQWHPEWMAATGNETMLELFRYQVRQARLFAEAKRLHGEILTLDSHTDTPMIFPGSFDLGRKEGGKVNLPLMEEGRLDAVVMVAYLPQGERTDEALRRATEYADERLSEIVRQQQINGHRMGIARTPADALRLKQEGKKALFLGIENGYAIGRSLSHVERYARQGVVYMTLCHNGDNDLCDSAAGCAEWGGLSPFGREVVAEMNRVGMMIDVSHAAESTFYDVLKHSRRPIIASHSSVRSLVDHPRNLTDEQIRALAANGGVVQICLYKGFVNAVPEAATLTDAIRHICHVVDLVGIDHVGIGSDFDGDGELIGCRAANELIQITVRLLALGFDAESIRKIWGGNLLRVMQQVQAGTGFQY